MSSAETDREETPTIPNNGDIEMRDVAEPIEDEAPVRSPEEILHDQRQELLSKIKPKTKEYEWRHITDAILQEPEVYKAKLILRIKNQFDLTDEIFYEILYSARYYPERADVDSLLHILDLIAKAFEQMSIDNQSKIDDFYFRFVACLNSFSKNATLTKLATGFAKLPSLTFAKYLLHDDAPYIKPGTSVSYSRYRKAILFDLVEMKKFNLLFESNEGYAKLIVFFSDAMNSSDSHFQVDYVNRSIETLIGHFKLDPTRVLDCLLDISMRSLFNNYRFVSEFFKKSQWWPKGNESDNSSIETLNKGGNPHVARLLGLKFNYYLKIDKTLSDAFQLFTTFCIKEGFVSFGSLLSYLSPNEDDMSKLKEKVADAIDDEIFKASANALALSGPLVDDENPADKTVSNDTKPHATKPLSEKEKLNEKQKNHKLLLLKSSLTVGLFWPSVYLLTKYPFLVHHDQDIPLLMVRLFNVMIQPLKVKTSPLTEALSKELRTPKKAAFVKHSSSSNTVQFEDLVIKDFEIYQPLNKITPSKRLIFFYHEWSDGVPTANNTDDLFRLSGQFLSSLGAKIGQDAQLLTHLIKFGVHDLESSIREDDYEKKLDAWFSYVRKYLLPASTYIDDNPITSNEFFNLMKKFPLDWRYNLYGDLNSNISKNNDFVRLNYSRAGKQTKDILKRITTENVSPMMRRLAKITFANPLASFLVVVSQIESYDNLTDLIVDAARYFTDYAWDVLPFVLLSRLTARRNAVQSDGLNDSPWLQSLATFIAKLAKGYAAFNIEPIISYILKDLHNGNTVGLTVLREVVNQMGGIQQNSNLTLTQIKLLNSSESLQKIIRKVILDTRESSERAADRLIQALLKDNQISELFILLSDFNRNLVSKSSENDHFKVVSTKLDETVTVIHTYTELLSFFLRNKKEVFIDKVISLSDLVSVYNIDFPWAFELWRNFIYDIDINTIEFKNIDFNNWKKELFANFWKLKLYDINYESDIYENEITRLKESNRSVSAQLESLRKERRHAETEARKRNLHQTEKENSASIEAILKDQTKHEQDTNAVSEEISSKVQSWFAEESPSTLEIQAFIEYCLVPRAIQSESDAVFASKFITNIFKPEVTKQILNKLINSKVIDVLIYTLSPLEAENLGLFFAETFANYEQIRKLEETSNDFKEVIYKWHSAILSLIKVGVESENYMSRRNSITLLKNLINIYPVIEDHGEEIVEAIKKVSLSETRKDLKLASDAILAHINARASKWIHLWEFYDFEPEEEEKLKEFRTQVLEQREAKKVEVKRIAMLKAQVAAREEREKREAQEAQEAEEERKAQELREAEAAALKAERSSSPDVNDTPLEGDQKSEDSKNFDKEDELIEDEDEIIEDDEEKESDDKPNVLRESNIKASTIKESSPLKSLKLPTGPKGSRGPAENRSSTAQDDIKPKKFKDVTATAKDSSNSKSASKPPDGSFVSSHLKDVLNCFYNNQYNKLLDVLNDKALVTKIEGLKNDDLETFRRKVGLWIKEYALGLYGDDPADERSRNYSSYRTFKMKLDDGIKRFKFPAKSEPSRPVRKSSALPPQSSVSGYANKPNTKWGMDTRNYNPGYSQGYQSGSNGGGPGGKYRTSGSQHGSSYSGSGNSHKRPSGYQDSYGDKRQRR